MILGITIHHYVNIHKPGKLFIILSRYLLGVIGMRLIDTCDSCKYLEQIDNYDACCSHIVKEFAWAHKYMEKINGEYTIMIDDKDKFGCTLYERK